MTEDPSYANVAEWLPSHVRDAIAATMDCPGNDTHDWLHHLGHDFYVSGRLPPVTVGEHWLCRNCGVDVRTDPEDYA